MSDSSLTCRRVRVNYGRLGLKVQLAIFQLVKIALCVNCSLVNLERHICVCESKGETSRDFGDHNPVLKINQDRFLC